ncbi:MAG TPA: ATP-binding protein, partial [Tepidisphaeraceae bacterium]
SEAMVLVEDLLRESAPPAPPAAPAAPAARLLHARLLLAEGKVQQAVRAYQQAVEQEGALKDQEFESRLAPPTPPSLGKSGSASGEVVDGKVRVQGGRGEMDDEEMIGEEGVERPTIAFADVGGMEQVKEEIRMKIIHPLAHPELYKAYGKAIGGGILMYGPPGCGKTHLARATAGEIDASFVNVGINDVLDMWLGNSERNLHAIFERARRNSPCVLFFDEVDALAASRADMRTSAGRHLINQFLAEMDGVDANNAGVLILAATNAPWHVDAAFRRPGRFDQILFIPPPDAGARESVLRIQLAGKPVDVPDLAQLAKKTDGFSGADLKAVVDVAVDAKLQEAIRAGAPKPLTTRDLLAAASKVKPSTREWFATAKSYAVYANQGGVYDDILKWLKM